MPRKQLPLAPNLEHLKSQARDLLKAYQERSPDAYSRIHEFFPKLSHTPNVEIQQAKFGLQDAQLVIAREYGFPSWPQLKHHIELGPVSYEGRSVMLYANVHWFRGLADGCRTFDEVLDKMEAKRDRIIRLKEIGCTINYSRDDYILVEIPESAVENYCAVIGMTPDELFVIQDGA